MLADPDIFYVSYKLFDRLSKHNALALSIKDLTGSAVVRPDRYLLDDLAFFIKGGRVVLTLKVIF